MYIIRSKTKVRENSESAKNEGVRREKRAALFNRLFITQSKPCFQWLMVNCLRGSRWPETIHLNSTSGRPSRSAFPVRGFMAYGQRVRMGGVLFSMAVDGLRPTIRQRFSVFLCDSLCTFLLAQRNGRAAHSPSGDSCPTDNGRGWGACRFLLLWMASGQWFANGALRLSVVLCALCVPFFAQRTRISPLQGCAARASRIRRATPCAIIGRPFRAAVARSPAAGGGDA
jgi:hypothetical protein